MTCVFCLFICLWCVFFFVSVSNFRTTSFTRESNDFSHPGRSVDWNALKNKDKMKMMTSQTLAHMVFFIFNAALRRESFFFLSFVYKTSFGHACCSVVLRLNGMTHFSIFTHVSCFFHWSTQSRLKNYRRKRWCCCAEKLNGKTMINNEILKLVCHFRFFSLHLRSIVVFVVFLRFSSSI